jgi:hypothetical protein
LRVTICPWSVPAPTYLQELVLLNAHKHCSPYMPVTRVPLTGMGVSLRAIATSATSTIYRAATSLVELFVIFDRPRTLAVAAIPP